MDWILLKSSQHFDYSPINLNIHRKKRVVHRLIVYCLRGLCLSFGEVTVYDIHIHMPCSRIGNTVLARCFVHKRENGMNVRFNISVESSNVSMKNLKWNDLKTFFEISSHFQCAFQFWNGLLYKRLSNLKLATEKRARRSLCKKCMVSPLLLRAL